MRNAPCGESFVTTNSAAAFVDSTRSRRISRISPALRQNSSSKQTTDNTPTIEIKSETNISGTRAWRILRFWNK
jgi:hypothetical protein